MFHLKYRIFFHAAKLLLFLHSKNAYFYENSYDF